jgi:hypothetical protein
VDVNTLFEVEVDGRNTIRPHIQTFQELYQEIRAFQQGHQVGTRSFLSWP